MLWCWICLKICSADTIHGNHTSNNYIYELREKCPNYINIISICPQNFMDTKLDNKNN